MADALVERVTGASSAEQRVEVCLVRTDRALFGAEDEPAQVPGYGPIPAEVARRWILSVLDLCDDDEDGSEDDGGEEDGDEREAEGTAGHPDELGLQEPREHARVDRARRHAHGRAWLRRLYTTPDAGHLVAMDSRRREFPGMLRKLIELRDQTCATPFCGAPIRHIDHIDPVRDGGQTSYVNGRGTCARCNLAKEAPGWSAHVVDDTVVNSVGTGGGPQRVVTVVTPTGHTYRGRPPPVHSDASHSEREVTSPECEAHLFDGTG